MRTVNHRYLAAALVALISLSTGFTATAGDLQKLTSAGASADAQFGRGASVSGEWAFLGAPADAEGSDRPGAVWVYRFDGTDWVEFQELRASDWSDQDEFGLSVDVEGTVAIVGAPGDDRGGDDAGSVYVFRFDGTQWIEAQKLLNDNAGDEFGRAVSLKGNVALIGAPGYILVGSAFVYRFDGTSWEEETQLIASDGANGDRFGDSVSLEDNVAVIGARGDRDNGLNSGSVYVYRYDGASWGDEQKIVASDGANNDRFGLSVSLQGNTALISAPGDGPGSVYVFRFDGTAWTEDANFTASDGAGSDYFGDSTSFSGDLALIGASGVNSWAGAAYLFYFDGTSWIELEKYVASDGEANDTFGAAVSLDNTTALIGAYRADSEIGAGYLLSSVVPDASACLPGTVNADNGFVTDVLYVNGSYGGLTRSVEVAEGDLLTITMLKPIAGGNGKFVLHANEGEPNFLSETALPFGIGTTCFPFLLTSSASPVIVANNIGKEHIVGESAFLGVPTGDPESATTQLFFPGLPLGTVLTFQGVIVDPATGSTKGVSTTNAVTMTVVSP